MAALVLGAGPALATIAGAPGAGVWGVNGRVWALARRGNTVYMGGEFTEAIAPDGVATEPRSNLAAIDTRSGQLTSWAPQADGRVYALALSGKTVLVGGDFATVTTTDGSIWTPYPRAHFAAIAADTYGSVRRWTADTDARVRSLAVSGTALYLGGSFDEVRGVNRHHLAALDLSSRPRGALLPWSPRTDRTVRAIAVMGNGNIVFGGQFQVVNGDATQTYLAAVTPSGELSPWADHPIDFVWDLEVIPTGDVVVGRGGTQGGSVAAYDEAGNERWHHGADGDVQAVGWANGQVIVGGHFANIGGGPDPEPPQGTHIPRLAAYDLSGGAHLDTTWIPWPNSAKGVWEITGTPDELLVGGDFTTMNEGAAVAEHFAQFTITP